MLEYAYYNQSELCQCIKKVLDEKKLYFYYMFPVKFFSLEIDVTDYNSIQFVSKSHDGTILGFLSAGINRGHDSIDSLNFINFTGKPNIVFSRDAEAFFDELFITRRFRKCTFSAIEQNPAITLYRKLIKKFDGREVGILKENKKLTDGKYYNEVLFEIFREGYLKSKRNYYKG